MRRIIIPGFKGGLASSVFDPLEKQTFQTAKDLDVYTDSSILKPHAPKLTAVTLPTISGGSSLKFHHSFRASNGKLYVLGEAVIAAASNFVLWSTTTLEASPTWTADYNVAVGSWGTTMDEFKDGLFFSQGTNFDRWGNLSGTPSRTNIGTVTTTATFIKTHRDLGKIFFIHNSGHTIGWYDNSTFTASALALETSETAIGAEPYGKFLIIGVRGAGSTNSKFLVWDGSKTTVDDTWNLGFSGLQSFKIINGTIRFVTSTQLGNDIVNRTFDMVPGGKPQLINETVTTLTTGTIGTFPTAVSGYGDLFLYGFKGSAHGIDLGIFAYGSGLNRVPGYLSAPWMLVSTGVTTGVSIESINFNGSEGIVIWSTLNGSGTYHIDAFGGSITKTATATGIYESNAFLLNAGDPGKIKRIIINHKPLPTGAGFTAKIKHYGHYLRGSSIPSEDTYQTLFTPEGNTSTSGMSQSTTNATYTIIEQPNVFKEARYGQLEILFDEVSTANVASIIFPIIIEIE